MNIDEYFFVVTLCPTNNKIKTLLFLVVTFQAHLALYCFANNQVSSALRLMYRTRYLALLCHGENHPEVGLIDVSLGSFTVDKENILKL